MSLDRLSRHIEEFFDLPGQYANLPEEIEGLSEGLAEALETPQIVGHLKAFLQDVSVFPKVQALVFMIDAWMGAENVTPGANVSCYFMHNNMLQINGGHELPHRLMSQLDVRSTERMVCFNGFYVNTGGNLEGALISLVRRTFDKDPGPFGVGRVEEEPPSSFIVALVNNNE